MKFNFWNNEKLPPATKKVLTPSQEFAKKAKGRFLAIFDAHYPASAANTKRVPEFVLAMRAFVIIVAITAVALGGTSVYADTKNVPADSPLYSLKRLNESVVLAFTAPQAKPALEATFATRRAEEISELEDRHPTSSLLPQLSDDFESNFRTSIDGVQKIKGNATSTGRPVQNNKISGDDENEVEVRGTCTKLRSLADTTSSVVHGVFSRNAGLLRRLDDNCDGRRSETVSSTITDVQSDPLLRARDHSNDEGETNATSTAATVTTDTSTTTTSSDGVRHDDNEKSGGGD